MPVPQAVCRGARFPATHWEDRRGGSYYTDRDLRRRIGVNQQGRPMKQTQGRMFVLADGRNVAVTFILVCSLFLLWGFCNGMIDVMDKHFQSELHLTLAQSAWVQFAHYLGYFLMALPAGWLATKLGYKAGIITGLLHGGRRRVLVHPGHQHRVVLGVPGGCLRHRGRPDVPRDDRESLYDGPGHGALRRDAHQPGAIVQRHRLDLRPDRRCGVLLRQGRRRQQHRLPDALDSVRSGRRSSCSSWPLIFFFADVPDVKMEDDYHLDDAAGTASHSIWRHPHFAFAVAAQFLYVAAQAGIFSFFINYMTSQPPPVPASVMSGALAGWFEGGPAGALRLTDSGAATLASLGFVCFLVGRFTGAAILRVFAAHRVLALYGALNVLACLVVVLKLGWVSVACVFLSYFFMSIMFPTIFALGIHGLGARAKKASAFIVMAIMGGALLPKLMGAVGDAYDMSRAFIVPMACFAFVAFYGYAWPRLSGSASLGGGRPRIGH